MPYDGAALAEAIDARLAAAGVPGAAVALVHRDGEPWVHTFGTRDAARTQPVLPDSLFRTSSISKTVIALAVMRLVEQGALRLQQPVRELLPEVSVENPWEGSHPLRLVHLLEHTSGLPDFHFPEILRPPEEVGRPPPPARERLAADPRWLRCRWPPGERYAYTNRGHALVAAILERLTGRPWPVVLRELVLEPLGLEGSGFVMEPERLRRLAVGYEDSRGTRVLPRPAYFLASANWAASVEDLARLTRFLLRRGEGILKAPTVSRMERPGSSAAARAGLFTGWGLGLVTRVNRSRPTVGRYGGGYAYQATFVYLPDQGVGYVAMVSASDQRRAFGEVQALLYEALGVPPSRPRAGAAATQEARRSLAGYYLPGNPRHEALALAERLLTSGWVVLEGGALRWRPVLPWAPAQSLEVWGHATSAEGRHLALRREGESGPGLVALTPEGRPPVLAGEVHYLERQPSSWPAVALASLAAGLLLALGGSLGGLLVVVVGNASQRLAVTPGLLATLAWLGGLGALVATPVHELGAFHTRAAAIFAASALQPALAAAAAAAAWKRRGATTLALALGHLVLAGGLWQAGWVGLRLWAD
jgi:CubicO group peptidase (beta-lactamase class C family)